MTSFATAEDLATYLREDVDTANAELLLAGATSQIQDYCGWDIASGTYTQRIDADAGSLVMLRAMNVQSVTSIVTASGDVVTDYTWSEDGMVRFGPSLVCWLNAFTVNTDQLRQGYPNGFGALTVTYEAGFDPIPASLQIVVCSIVARALTVPPGTQQEESIAGGRTEMARYFNVAGFGLAEIEIFALNKYALPRLV